jgi:hypothetical protein
MPRPSPNSGRGAWCSTGCVKVLSISCWRPARPCRRFKWSEREDLNLRPLVPQTSCLPLRYLSNQIHSFSICRSDARTNAEQLHKLLSNVAIQLWRATLRSGLFFCPFGLRLDTAGRSDEALHCNPEHICSRRRHRLTFPPRIKLGDETVRESEGVLLSDHMQKIADCGYTSQYRIEITKT